MNAIIVMNEIAVMLKENYHRWNLASTILSHFNELFM